MQIPYRKAMLSWNSSAITSPVLFVGDAITMSISLTTTTTASTYTVQGSNSDGFTVAIAAGQWSTITLLTTQGIYAVEPGFRWIRALQAASNSSATMYLAKLS
jgi:hypothetical protein